MNSTNNLFFVLIILFAEKAVSREVQLNEVDYAPLALIRKRDSKLEQAIPRKSKKDDEFITYDYDDSKDEFRRVEEFIIACPADENENHSGENYAEEELKKFSELAKTSKLFVLREYTKPEYTCSDEIQPSIKKAEEKDRDSDVEYCQKYNADLYYVGYPVSKKNGKDLQFVSIYKICYSTEENKGLLYTIHNIESPSLLLQKLWEFYKLDLKMSIKTTLDKRDRLETYKNKYAYQYVGFNDMPIKAWKKTTLFSFNYTPISKSRDILKGMIAADNYIRLYSKETGNRLILYSGTYQKIIDKALIPCIPLLRSKKIPVDSFWRLIMDDEGKAIILVTQYTLIKCDDQTYLCEDGRKMIKVYKNGGCTYTCPVTDLLSRFNLPPLITTGILSLKIPRKPLSGSTSYVGGGSSSYAYLSMTDFMRNLAFLTVLMTYDRDLASSVQIISTTDGHGYVDIIPSSDGGGGGNSDVGGGGWSFDGDTGGGGGGGGGFDICF